MHRCHAVARRLSRSACYRKCCPCSLRCAWSCCSMFLFWVEAVSVQSCAGQAGRRACIQSSAFAYLQTRIHKAPVSRLLTSYFCGKYVCSIMCSFPRAVGCCGSLKYVSSIMCIETVKYSAVTWLQAVRERNLALCDNTVHF